MKVGDRVLLYGIADREVTDYCVCDDGSFAINNFQYDQDQRLKKPEQPDSWEQLSEDAMKGQCTYFGTLGDKSVTCINCEYSYQATGRLCRENMQIDLVKRAKKLAGIEEEVRNGD